MSIQTTDQSQRANARIVVICLALVSSMAILSYASVPLYRIFCQVTGYGGTTQRVELTADIPILARKIEIRFDANVSKYLLWKFQPKQREVTVNLGESTQISYLAENLSDKPVTGMATFNVTPQHAGAFFNKIECFCFTQTTLQPGEKLEMPVVFFIDPDLDKENVMKNLETITLSYTFFEQRDEETPLAAIKKSDDNKQIN